ncbi:MAG TPA: zinc ribbon domain-containing protein [Fimbriimonadaceae bacterium]|jgi:hypothetical protein
MLIFGWGRRTNTKLGQFGPAPCPRCHNNALYQHIKQRRWFSLFFIPVIPYETHEFLVCEICSNGWLMSAGQSPEAMMQSLSDPYSLPPQAVQGTPGVLVPPFQNPQLPSDSAPNQ